MKWNVWCACNVQVELPRARVCVWIFSFLHLFLAEISDFNAHWEWEREKTHSPYYAFNFCKHELAEMEKLHSDFYQKLIKICQQGNSTREGEVAASSHNKKFIIFLLVFVSSGEYEALTLCLRMWRSAKNGGTRDARRAIIEMNMHSYIRGRYELLLGMFNQKSIVSIFTR